MTDYSKWSSLYSEAWTGGKKKKLSNIPPLSSDERNKLGLTGPPTNRVGSKVDKSTWPKGKKPKVDKPNSNEKAKRVSATLASAAKAVDQFRESRRVDWSGLNESSRGSAQETDLTAPGYSDYFARDNNGPV